MHALWNTWAHSKVQVEAPIIESRQMLHSSLPVAVVFDKTFCDNLDGSSCWGTLFAVAIQRCLWLAFQWARWQSLLQYSTRPHRLQVERWGAISLPSGAEQLSHILPLGTEHFWFLVDSEVVVSSADLYHQIKTFKSYKNEIYAACSLR
jgi:hypothetical protein